MKYIIAHLLCSSALLLTTDLGFAAQPDLPSQFKNPPGSARPWVYWWWLAGNVSREGITRDLEEMKRQGIGGVLIFQAGGEAGPMPTGPTFLSPAWRELFQHALREIDRLGLEASVNLCDGWDAGGPWIRPEQANKKLVYSQVLVQGPGRASQLLPMPPRRGGYYRDVAVLAIREDAAQPVPPAAVTASSTWSGYVDEWNWPPSQAADGDPHTAWRPHQHLPGPAWLQLAYHDPIPATSLYLAPAPSCPGYQYELQASEDGENFRSVTRFRLDKGAAASIPFAPTTARAFRIVAGSRTDPDPLASTAWIWAPQPQPATLADPGTALFRKTFTLPAGRKIRQATFFATADNTLAHMALNGQPLRKRAEEDADFHRIKRFDLTALLNPGPHTLAFAAINSGDAPNPAGAVARLVVEFDSGEPFTLNTDESWRCFPLPAPKLTVELTPPAAPEEQPEPPPGPTDWQKPGFNDSAWPTAKKAAAYGEVPWGPLGRTGELEIAEAWVLRDGDQPPLRPGLKWWPFKSANRSFWDYPREGPTVLGEEYPDDGSRDYSTREVIDLTPHVDASGYLIWTAPPGRWTILRFGSTLQGQMTRAGTASDGLEADMLDSAGIEAHFAAIAEPLLADARAAGARNLKYLHIDSYELGADVHGQQPTWTENFRQEFRARRGYDLLPYLPIMARRIADGRQVSNRFLWDYRRTIGDLMAEKFFGRFSQLAHARGIGVHSETGYGTYPHPHIDSLQCAGINDIPMGEFWHANPIMSQFNHYANVIRSVASAGHIYGRPIVQAESFTTFSHYTEFPFAIKRSGDEAFCDGLNRIVFHQYSHQPYADAKPGWQYGAGMHFDRNLTWWRQGSAYLQYLARCQHLLQQGQFFADVCYFYGEGTTRFVPSPQHQKPALPAGYDCDTINTDILLNRLTVRDGRLAIPGGPSYRLLILPESPELSPAALERLKRLLEAGATIYGERPGHAPGLTNYPACDAEARRFASALWGDAPTPAGDRNIGAGRLIWGKPLAFVLAGLGLPADLEIYNKPAASRINFIHRVIGADHFYFVANLTDRDESFDCLFRVGGGQPEIWDPLTGTILALPDHRPHQGRTLIPLAFAPRQSYFVVFRAGQTRPTAPARGRVNFPALKPIVELTGPWNVSFDPAWGGPTNVEFPTLTDWTRHSEEGIKHYSGTAIYRKTFNLPEALRSANRHIYLDVGAVRHIAEVRLNGQPLGILWTAPWRVELTPGLRTHRKHAGDRSDQPVAESPDWRRQTPGGKAPHPHQCHLLPQGSAHRIGAARAGHAPGRE